MSKATSRARESLLVGLLIGVMAGVVFAAGFVVRGTIDTRITVNSVQSDEITYSLLGEVQHILDLYYLRPQPGAKIQEYAAVRGMLATLNDRFTFFIEPAVAQSETDVLSGTYGGIGATLQRSEIGDILIFPFADSPASRAGISGGDVLLTINSEGIDPNTPPDVLDQALRGEVKSGNGVSLTLRKPDGEITNVFVEFDVITVPSIMWRMVKAEPAIGYVHISLFTSRTPDELTQALNEIRTVGATGLIIDLRGNSGGLLQEAVMVASQFLREGLVVLYEKSRDGERAISAGTGGQMIDLPLAILVDDKTASAAELIAAALRDHGRGVLIGQRTFGKGTVQQIFRLSDDSSLHVTASEWLAPSRMPIDRVGLQPDLPMVSDNTGRDIELGEAIRVLEREITEIRK